MESADRGNRLTDTERRLVAASGGGQGRRGKGWEFGLSRCKQLYTGWISNKVLLYGTGSPIQYPVISHNGKQYIKMYICV